MDQNFKTGEIASAVEELEVTRKAPNSVLLLLEVMMADI
jgi:hypothetical protein